LPDGLIIKTIGNPGYHPGLPIVFMIIGSIKLPDLPIGFSQGATEVTPTPFNTVDVSSDRPNTRTFCRHTALSDYPDLPGFIIQLVSALPERAKTVGDGPNNQNIFAPITRGVTGYLVDCGLFWTGRKQNG
jgi:hypothetical protein